MMAPENSDFEMSDVKPEIVRIYWKAINQNTDEEQHGTQFLWNYIAQRISVDWIQRQDTSIVPWHTLSKILVASRKEESKSNTSEPEVLKVLVASRQEESNPSEPEVFRSAFRLGTGLMPWRTMAEFKDLRKAFYSNIIEDNIKAVETVAQWMKQDINILEGVAATAQIVLAQITEYQCDQGVPSLNISHVRTMHGMAVAKFCSLLVDPIRTDTGRTVNEVAQKCEMPEETLNLRSEFWHSSMPPLDALRAGSFALLRYLKKYFWMELEKNLIVDSFDRSELVLTVKNLIKEFRSLRKEEIVENGGKDTSKTERVIAELDQMCGFAYDTDEIFFNALTEPGVFLADDDNKLLANKYSNNKVSQDMELPKGLLEFWKPLIKIFQQKNRLETFICYLVQKQSDHKSDRCQKWCLAWGMSVAVTVLGCESTLTEFLKPTPIKFNTELFIVCCILGGTKYTASALHRIFDLMSVEERKQMSPNVKKLIGIYLTKTFKLGKMPLVIKPGYTISIEKLIEGCISNKVCEKDRSILELRKKYILEVVTDSC